MLDSRSQQESRGFVPIILAAGRGARLGGRAKALVDLNGKSAIARCLEACLTAAADVPLAAPTIVVGDGGKHIAAHVSALALVRRSGATDRGWQPRFVTNPAPDRGQTSSVQIGLGAAQDDAPGFLVWPVDHPLVEAADLVALIERALSRSEAPIVLLSHAGRAGHPALLRASVRADIMALDPGEPLRAVMRAHRGRTVFVVSENRGVIFDIDTPEDLEAATALLSAAEGHT